MLRKLSCLFGMQLVIPAFPGLALVLCPRCLPLFFQCTKIWCHSVFTHGVFSKLTPDLTSVGLPPCYPPCPQPPVLPHCYTCPLLQRPMDRFGFSSAEFSVCSVLTSLPE
jgi:hypothetical protein